MSFFTQSSRAGVYAHGWGLSMDLSLVSDVYYHAKHPPRVLWKCTKSPLGFFLIFQLIKKLPEFGNF
jgi:hypothetical protein